MNFEDIFRGGAGGFDFQDIFGGFGGRSTTRRKRKGEDLEYALSLDFLQAANGVTTTIQVQRPTGGGSFRTERIDVKVPAGVDNGSRVRVRGKGGPGVNGGPPGDLYIVVQLLEHPYFRRIGRDVYIDLPVSAVEAMLGAKVDVPTLDGRGTLTVPAGASSGTRLRMKDKGILNPKTNKRGDQYAVVKVVVPKSLSDQGKELVRKLGETDPLDPRKGVW